MIAVALVAPAQGANGTFDRTWGEDVISGNADFGFEICTLAASCKTGVFGDAQPGGELSSPSGVATDGAGNVYVADNGHNRVQKLDSAGAFERTWGENVISGNAETGFEICTLAADCTAGASTAPALGGEMNSPAGVATDGAGNVYVADALHHRVQKFDSSGAFERAWGEDVVESGEHETAGDGFEVCVNPAGSNPDDVCKTGVTTGAALGGEMNIPRGVAADGAGNVYVADTFHHRVQKFNSAGAFERAWGKDVVESGEHETAGDDFEVCVNPVGSNPDDVCKAGVLDLTSDGHGGEVANPAGVATDGAGNVYVADTGYNRIQKLDSAGAFERAWGEDVISGNASAGFEVCVNGVNICKAGTGGPGTAPALGGEMHLPAGVAIDGAGEVYVADTGYHRVQRFDSAGAFERAWGEDVVESGEHETADDGLEICVNPAGSNPDDVCKVGVVAGVALGGEMNSPFGVATDGAGNVYVADKDHHRIQKFADPGPPGAIAAPSNAFTTATCKGEQANIVGTDGNDELVGTDNRDVIAALDGNDEVSGLGGEDLICGGKNKDTLRGGKNKDKLLGQKGRDKLKGGGGRDVCKGGKGNDSGSCEVEKSL